MPVPVTQIRTSHAITIRVGGAIIGQIQQWSPSQSRTVNPQYEINATATGEIFEQVPSVVSNCTIQVTRYDLYAAKMEEVWGTSKAFWMLSDQYNPIDVEEKWIRINDKKLKTPWGSYIKPTWGKDMASKVLGKWGLSEDELEGIQVGEAGEVVVEKLWYSGCYFSQMGRVVSATGDRIVMANATLNYKKVRPL